jgi:hypothetical protein
VQSTINRTLLPHFNQISGKSWWQGVHYTVQVEMINGEKSLLFTAGFRPNSPD